MTAFDDLTWHKAMRQGHTALIESESLYDDITHRRDAPTSTSRSTCDEQRRKPPRDLNVGGHNAGMATGPDPIRIGNQHPFAVPPDRRDPAPRLRGHHYSIAQLGGML